MQRKIKVLHVIHSLFGGGAETQLKILCQAGIEHGIDSTTFCIEGYREDLVEGRHVISYQRKSKLDIGIYSAIKSAIAKVDADIVHAWLPPVVSVPAIVAAKKSGIPVITSYRSSKKIRNYKDVFEYMVSLYAANGIASNTPIELCSLPYRWLHKKKQGVVIPNAVLIPENKLVLNELTGSDGDVLKILFVGRVSKEKNWQCLIKAVEQISNDLPWTLTICGKGPEESQLLDEIDRRQLSEKIRVPGFTEDIYKVMVAHDVLVLPSWYEGVPNVLFEAFAAGLPAIISDIPPHRSIVGDNDLVLTFPPDSPDRLCSRLEQISKNVDLGRQLSENAREFVKVYRPDKMAEAYFCYYNRLLDNYAIQQDLLKKNSV